VSILKRIAIVGPECTGKSTLSSLLAQHYKTTWVPEFARTYLDELKRPYEQDDLLSIARGQLQSEDEHAKKSTNLLVCDTNLVVIKIWSEFKYGSCHPEILQWLTQRYYHLHLLTHVDIPWEYDPQREHPDKREQLYSLYKNELTALQVPFIEIKGTTEERLTTAIKAIELL
jgi:NadR type nicotinamide-nucleotide adenylyltransferase